MKRIYFFRLDSCSIRRGVGYSNGQFYLCDAAVAGGFDVAEVADVADGRGGRAVFQLVRVKVRACGRAAVRVVAELVHVETMLALK